MLVQETHLDVVTNNLANVDTLGFRRRIPVNEEFSAHLDRLEKVSEDDERKIVTVPPFTMNWKGKQTIGTLALANVFSESAMDTTPGVVRVTDNPLDLLIDGPGFFAVQDGAGNTFYTRQGSFALSDDGVVITQDGMTLQGDGGDGHPPGRQSRRPGLRGWGARGDDPPLYLRTADLSEAGRPEPPGAQ